MEVKFGPLLMPFVYLHFVKITCDLQIMTNRSAHLLMKADSLSLFDVPVKPTITTEKLLIVNLNKNKDSLFKMEPNNGTSLRSEFMFADP